MPVLFLDRDDAGRKLAKTYDGPTENVVVLGIPRGGVPVGRHVADAAGGLLDVIVVRKLPIPTSPEAGFGAIAPDGSLVLNEAMLRSIGLPEGEIDRIASIVLREVLRREAAYRGDRPFTELKDTNVIITDDGLATGYTMIAAVKMARARGPTSVAAVVPVSPTNTASRVRPLVDYFHCLHFSGSYPFAVASFYRDFHDMSDDEVLRVLRGQGVEPRSRRRGPQ